MAVLTLTGLTTLAIGDDDHDETNLDRGTAGGDAGRAVERSMVDVVALLERLDRNDDRMVGADLGGGDAGGATVAPVDTPAPAEEPAAEPAPATGGALGDVEAACALGPIEAIICSYDWDDATALRTFRCESGTDAAGVMDGAWAVGDGSYGVAQIQDVHAPGIPDFWDHWMLPEFNVAWAYGIWRDWENDPAHGNGWLQWSCY